TYSFAPGNYLSLCYYIYRMLEIVIIYLLGEFFLKPVKYRLLKVTKPNMLHLETETRIRGSHITVYRQLRNNSPHKIHVYFSLILNWHLTPVFTNKKVFNKEICRTCNINLTRNP